MGPTLYCSSSFLCSADLEVTDVGFSSSKALIWFFFLNLVGPFFLIGPFPIRNFRSIDAEPISVFLARDALVHQLLAHVRAGNMKPGHPVDGVDGQTEAIGVIPDRKLQRSIDVTLFLVAADMDMVLTRSAIGEAVDQPRVPVEVKDYRLIRRENGLELTIRHTVRVLGVRHQPEKV